MAWFTARRNNGKDQLHHASGTSAPSGGVIERNIVVTTWDWGDEKQYLHDLISSDKRLGIENRQMIGRITIKGDAWPACTRRIQASSPLLNSPKAAGIVRVESLPS